MCLVMMLINAVALEMTFSNVDYIGLHKNFLFWTVTYKLVAHIFDCAGKEVFLNGKAFNVVEHKAHAALVMLFLRFS